MINEQNLHNMSKVNRKVVYLCYIFLITTISSCQTNQLSMVSPLQSTKISEAEVNEVIMFCGNPGVGKSTLCNSIFQQAVFESGLSFFTGLTTVKQEYLYEGKLYIDTPGLDDVKKRDQAVEEIEEALKHNKNYKIVFVAKLNSGRIRNSDLDTMNLVCKAINTPFEYGIIFNQVSRPEMLLFEKMNTKQIIESLSDTLVKKPALILILEEDKALEHASNKYLQGNDENRSKLLDFINNLRANKIEEKHIEKIDTRTINEKVKEAEETCKQTYTQKLQELQDRIDRQEEEESSCIII